MTGYLMRRLPSLNGLRAFEAAARHGSFVGCEPGAERHPGGGEPHGAAARRPARPSAVRAAAQRSRAHRARQGAAARPYGGFDAIAASAEQVVAMRTTPVLTIGVGPSFAMRWMIPRLASFYDAHPEIEVRLATGGAINPFKDDWTCGILLGNGDWPGLCSRAVVFGRPVSGLHRCDCAAACQAVGSGQRELAAGRAFAGGLAAMVRCSRCETAP